MTKPLVKLPHFLLAAYAVYFVAAGLSPFSRSVWIAENIPIFFIVLLLFLTYEKFVFSNASYLLMSVLVFLHTTGGHYTFERVPFGFITDFFGFSRNNFDKLAHFSVGFYAYPVAEFIYRNGYTASKGLLVFTGITAIFTVAASYEIIEWQSGRCMGCSKGYAF